jgi:hypothetical protein
MRYFVGRQLGLRLRQKEVDIVTGLMGLEEKMGI